ncbi:hypothetical protein [Monaibacterium marinum]|uniref:hypothetical protein n=1 Tax=Pontivivens marinum TaxID=1690039 RepID=UPI000BF0D5D1|nr:hypothetical protein [Monaibacterium marinum]
MADPHSSRFLIVIGRIIVLVLIAGAVLLAISEYTGLTQVRGDLLAYSVKHNLLAMLLFGYAMLLALPFVPGVTLGFAIMMVFGPQTAPVVWLASVCGLTFTFSLGRIAPRAWFAPLLVRVGLQEKLRYLQAGAGFSEQERLLGLFGAHPWVARLIGWRYVALAVLVVLPGNVLIGGAGGISLLAGLSRAFHPVKFVLAVGLPMAPLPFAVYVFGIDILPAISVP